MKNPYFNILNLSLLLLLTLHGCKREPRTAHPPIDDHLCATKPVVAHLEPKVIHKTMTITAYCPCEKCCGKWSDGMTACGHQIRPGDVFVASPPEIPFGTMISIPGYNGGRPVPVLDRGGAIKGNRLDVFFGEKDINSCSAHERALNWGRQTLSVIIYE